MVASRVMHASGSAGGMKHAGTTALRFKQRVFRAFERRTQ
jgi:hypothetical protein